MTPTAIRRHGQLYVLAGYYVDDIVHAMAVPVTARDNEPKFDARKYLDKHGEWMFVLVKRTYRGINGTGRDGFQGIPVWPHDAHGNVVMYPTRYSASSGDEVPADVVWERATHMEHGKLIKGMVWGHEGWHVSRIAGFGQYKLAPGFRP
jgi:hypothetical protein